MAFKEYSYPIFLWICLIVMFLLSSSSGLFFGILYLYFFCISEHYFTKWALIIKKSPEIAFLIIMITGPLGLIFYYIYFRIKSLSL
jgi:hypothetical protein